MSQKHNYSLDYKFGVMTGISEILKIIKEGESISTIQDKYGIQFGFMEREGISELQKIYKMGKKFHRNKLSEWAEAIKYYHTNLEFRMVLNGYEYIRLKPYKQQWKYLQVLLKEFDEFENQQNNKPN